MGLDNLIDDEDDESKKEPKQTSFGGVTSETESNSGKFSSPSITDDKTGMYGYNSKDEYEDTIEGELELKEDLFKYRLPIFSHIENEMKYNFGGRYRMEHNADIKGVSGVCSCIYMRKITLSNIPRELIMLDTGKTEKKESYEVLEKRFEQNVNDNSTVYLYLFLYTRHITKMAIGDEQVESWSTYPIDRQLKAVYNETYTQEFRETAGGPPNLKHTDQIGIWETEDDLGVDEK